jgi:hypothetical protein
MTADIQLKPVAQLSCPVVLCVTVVCEISTHFKMG